jgi:ADP-ribosylglycohydrolase
MLSDILAHSPANTGGDTDTIGAIACGIAGAFSGIERFDRTILDKVIAVNDLDMESIAKKLLELYD